MTIQERVWLALKERGPMTALELSAYLGLASCGKEHPSSQASYAARKLVAKRKAEVVEGAGKRHPVYKARGKKPPADMRGKTEGSRAALNECRSANAVRYHLNRGHKLRPVATTALEQCWGWLPRNSQSLQAKNESNTIDGGEVRPKEAA